MSIKKIISFIITVLLLFIGNNLYADNYKNISPVVQIISFSDTNGKLPFMLGWGSASIINDKGIIISNNHVVENENSVLASAFSVCITTNENEKPKCDYTASLINRDDKLDISILKIDAEDIYGNTVNYKSFKYIEVDFDYLPTVQDEVVAIGYPWIGADTITQTKGVVSGTTEYNYYKYIKTDTTIAGGNSGGALINSRGKIIGIPTFGIGGWGDNSMGYALLISEAKDFILENILKDSQKNKITEIIDFGKYRNDLETINKSGKVVDDLFTFIINPNYEIFNYYKNTNFVLSQKRSAEDLIKKLDLSFKNIREFKNDKEFFYYLENTGFYNKEYQKLLKKNIGGVDFYYPVNKDDLNNGDYWGNFYQGYYNNKLVTINIEADLYNEKLKEKLKNEINKILGNITLNKENFEKVNYEFSTNIPKIEIKSLTGKISNIFEYGYYFGDKLYESMSLNMGQIYLYDGKGKTAKEIYDVVLRDKADEQKDFFSFKGLEGYYYCNDSINEQNYGDYYFNYYYNYFFTTDENGNPINLSKCNFKIFYPLDKELNRHNYINIELISKKENILKNLDNVLDFLKQNLETNTIGVTSIKNIYKEQINLKFKDISYQDDSYEKFLKILVKYGVIKNTSYLSGDRAVRWGEFAYMYTKFVYKYSFDEKKCKTTDYKCLFNSKVININGQEKTLNSILKEIGISNYEEYVDYSKAVNFGIYMNYKLAGLNVGNFTSKDLNKITRLIDKPSYASEKDKLNNFINSIYGLKQVTLYEVLPSANSYYEKEHILYFDTFSKKLFTDDLSINNVVSMSYSNDISYKRLLTYLELNAQISKDTFSSECLNKSDFYSYKICEKSHLYNIQRNIAKLNEYTIGTSNDKKIFSSYEVLQKGEMLDIIFKNVDFALFDKKFEDKKQTIVE
ncbi:MAG: S1C family serine protease [Candidatus Gracilibacteria bacterium]|nr:S1C family serine protease [Candidatus Gracilibacteria bacterium]